MTITIKPSGQACGAAVYGLDLTKALDDSTVAAVRAAWIKYQVLSFPEQLLNDDDLERFTLYFGPFSEDPFVQPIPGREHIIAVQRNATETSSLFAEAWHTEWSFQPHPPAGLSLVFSGGTAFSVGGSVSDEGAIEVEEFEAAGAKTTSFQSAGTSYPVIPAQLTDAVAVSSALL